MANGGARPGAGRKRGGKNKATIEREINAAAVIDRARKEGRELAVDVLERIMKLCEGAAGAFRPTTQRDVAAGNPTNPDGNEPVFGQWVDRWTYCAKELAKYQSPQVKAIEQPAPPPDVNAPEDKPRLVKLRVFEGGKPVASFR